MRFFKGFHSLIGASAVVLVGTVATAATLVSLDLEGTFESVQNLFGSGYTYTVTDGSLSTTSDDAALSSIDPATDLSATVKASFISGGTDFLGVDESGVVKAGAVKSFISGLFGLPELVPLFDAINTSATNNTALAYSAGGLTASGLFSKNGSGGVDGTFELTYLSPDAVGSFFGLPDEVSGDLDVAVAVSTADLAAVPLPATAPLLMAAFGLVALRKRFS